MKNNKLIKPWSTQGEKHEEVISFKKNNIIQLKSREITDYSSLSFQCSFGVTNTEIKKSLKNATTGNLVTISKYYSQIQEKSAKRLCQLLKLDGKIFFTSSGAESTEHALKICRHATKRTVILSRQKSYHGATMAASQVTGDWRRTNIFMPQDGHHFLPEPSEDPTFEKAMKIINKIGPEKIAGIFLETISAKNGVHDIPETWWKNLTKLQLENGIKIILDEVVCGFFRTGKAFGFQHYSIKPDIVTMGKAISNGMAPLGAVFFSKELMKFYENTILPSGLTNFAHPLSLGAFAGVDKIISAPTFQSKIKENIKIIKEWLNSLGPLINGYRGKGFLYGIELYHTPPVDFFDKKNIHIVTNQNLLIFCPVITMTKNELKNALKKLEQAIRELK